MHITLSEQFDCLYMYRVKTANAFNHSVKSANDSIYTSTMVSNTVYALALHRTGETTI